MFKNKPRKNRAEALRSSKLRLENLEERQLLTAVGIFDVPYGPDTAPVVCAAAPEVDDSPTVDLTSVAANTESELVLATTGTTWTVNSLADDENTAGTLRYFVNNSEVKDGDTIMFADSLKGKTITLGSTLSISKSLTINASNLYENGTPGITINGAQKGSVIKVNNEATVVINGLKITNGSATKGGGIYIDWGCKAETINTTISENTSEDYGGGGVYVDESATYTSTNTTISRNTTGYYGGGVYVDWSATYTSINTTISGNTAGYYGGGVYVSGTYTSTNTTISGNMAEVSGGGVFVSSYTIYTAQNSIIVGNSAYSEGNEIYGPVTAGEDSLTSGDEYAIFANYNKGDYSLKADSPAIDKGNNSYVPKDITTDIKGLSRFAFVTVDIGAYEYHASLTNVKIDGTAEVGKTLTATVNAKRINPTATYQWYRDGKAIEGENKQTYEVKQEDFCRSLTVKASGTDDFLGTVVSGSVTPKTTTIKPTYENFKAAFDQAKDGATIKFTSSVTTQTISVTSTIILDKNITIDGTDANVAIDGGNANRIFNVASGKTVELKNLTLQNGKAGTDESPENGGAIYNDGNLTLTGVVANSNAATKNGGAVFNNFGASLTVKGGSITGNVATNNGGAFANYGTMTIEGDVLTLISKNTASRFGGAYFGCGTLNVTGKARFEQNEVTADGSKGGAIYNDVNGTNVGTVSITGNVVFYDNKAVERGGAIMSYSNDANAKTPALTVKGTTIFAGNEALQYGGAIDVGQGCSALLGGNLSFNNNKATSTNADEGFGGAIFSVATLKFEAGGTYMFENNTATKSGGAIDACDGTLTLAGEFWFSSNEAKGVYKDDQTGLGGSIATAAVTTVANGTTFEWENVIVAARGNCVALDSEISPELKPASFGLESGADYSTFKVIRTNSVMNSAMFPTSFAPNAVVATITTSGVSTTFGAEGVTPEELGLDAGTHEALIQYVDANGATSAVYSLVLTVDSAASLAVRETSFANDRGVKFDFNLTNADGRAVSVWEIAWGDGTTSRLEKLSTSWLAAHYYAQDGTFDVSLTVAYLDGTSETFEAFATQTIGASPVATTGKADAFACVFAEPEDLFDVFEEFGNLIGPMPLR